MNQQAFEYIEKHPEGVTPEMLADKLGIRKESAASWLSRWKSEGYLKRMDQEPEGRRGRLSQEVGAPRGARGRYVITNDCKWWGERFFDGNQEFI